MSVVRKVLLIGSVWPEPTSSAAGLRQLNLVDAFLNRGWEVWFGSASKPNEFKAQLEARGISTVQLELNDSTFDQWIGFYQPDCVVFDRFIIEEQFGGRVQSSCPSAMRILDTQDLHFLRRGRMAALFNGSSLSDISRPDLPYMTAEGSESATHSENLLREIASIYRSDLSLVISSFECDLLTRRFGIPDSLLQLLRLGYPDLCKNPPYETRSGFGVIGNFRHPPNADGIRWLRSEIWPRIRAKMSNAEVDVYGAYPPKEIMALDDPSQGFRVRGWAKDQYETLKRFRVNLAPLRFGAGIKGKIADGFWCGTPAVTTPIGAEGMTDLKAWGGAICEDPNEFAERAVELAQDRDAWEAAQAAGYQIIAENYSQVDNTRMLMDRVESLHSSLSEARLKNVVGQILWHQQFRSTTYFSRWIELKKLLPIARGASSI